jgi:hypothetical protein
MVGHCQGQVRPADLASGQAQRFEGLGARHLMDEVPVDIDEAGPVLPPFDDVSVPDLLI